MRLEVVGDHVSLSFSKNNKGLGIAYEINGWEGAILRPVVSMDKAGQQLEIQRVENYDLEKNIRHKGTPEGIIGSWQHETGEYKLIVEQEQTGILQLGLKVANTFSCRVRQLEGEFSVMGSVVSTKMMPPPELQAVETFFRNFLTDLTSITRQEEKLVLKATGSREELFIVGPGTTPATKERIRWMNM